MSESPAVEHAPEERSETGNRSAFEPLGHFLFKHRNYLFPIAFIALVLLDRPRYAFGSASWDRLVDALGILLAAGGQVLRALVIGLTHIRRGGEHGRVHADELVTSGVYAHSRNPLYVGNVAVFAGIFVVLNSVLGYVVGVPAVLLTYYSLVVAEERFLRAKFGAPYDDYCRRVNRFWPTWSGLGRTVAGMHFHWRRAVRVEYGPAWTWMSTIVGLLLWQRLAHEGFDAVRGDLPLYFVAWGLITLGWAGTRYLKKSGRLR